MGRSALPGLLRRAFAKYKNVAQLSSTRSVQTKKWPRTAAVRHQPPPRNTKCTWAAMDFGHAPSVLMSPRLAHLSLYVRQSCERSRDLGRAPEHVWNGSPYCSRTAAWTKARTGTALVQGVDFSDDAASTRNPTGRHSHSRARLVVTSKVRTDAKANGRWNGAVRLAARPTVRARDRCVLATGLYSLQVCTRDRCVLTTGVYSRQVCTHDRCVLTTGVYSRQY